MELKDAYIHGIRQLGYNGSGTIRPGGDTLENNNYFIASIDNTFWSSSSWSENRGAAWRVYLDHGDTNVSGKSNLFHVICVSP